MEPYKRDAQTSSEIKEVPDIVVPETMEPYKRDAQTSSEIEEAPAKIEVVRATKKDASNIVDTYLEQKNSPVIVLTGVAGVGKSWMANQVSEDAEKKNCSGTIWISLDQKHDDESFYADVARQLSLLDNADEWDAKEEDNAEEKKKEDEEGKPEEPNAKRTKKIDEVKQKIKERIEEKAPKPKEEKKEKTEDPNAKRTKEIGPLEGEPEDPNAKRTKKIDEVKPKIKERIEDKAPKPKEEKKEIPKYLLWVLDEGFKMQESEEQMQAYLIEMIINILKWGNSKILITSGRPGEKVLAEPLVFGNKNKSGLQLKFGKAEIKVQPLTCEEASKLVDRIKRYKNVPDTTAKHLREAIKEQKKKTEFLPADVIMILGALNCIAEQNYQNALHLPKLEELLKEVIDRLTAGEEDLVKGMLLSALEALQGNQKLVDCFWHAWEFFQARRGAVHYNELVTHWILEGCFDPVEHLEKAYTEGHGVMMKLVDYGMLRIQEDNGMFMEGLGLKIKDERRRGISATANLGMAPMLKDKWKGFGRVAPADGMIKTLRLGEKEKEDLVSTLLVDGSCIHKKTPKQLFLKTHKLQVLGVFDSMLLAPPPEPPREPDNKALPKPDEPPLEPDYKDLHILVLRRCYLLKDMSHIKRLDTLTALEISGATFLKKIPDEFFESATQLQSLNLSETGVELLPKSLSNLTKLRRLILKRCLNLLNLPPVRKLNQLEVLDLSECFSLERLGDMCFQSLEKLEILDLSYTRIQRMPIINSLSKLSQLLLKGCDNLGAMRKLQRLTGLKYLDISGVTKIREIHEEFLNGTENIEEVDLSGTGIQVLPNFGKVIRVLKLRDCSKLEVLPKMPKSLELLDLSNASSLQTIEDESFGHLTKLQCLNLSNTKVKKLPSLNGLNKLEILLLEGCSLLEELPEMKEFSGLKNLKLKGCKMLRSLPLLKDLVNLEEIDLSACEALSEVQADCFNHLPQLQKLNLSETQIKRLPSLSDSRNLQSLVLRNCKKLESFPDLAPVSKLVELDLLGTSLEDVKAQSLNHLTQLQIMRLQKIMVEEFSTISFHSSLKELSLNSWSGFTEAWGDLRGLEVLELSDDAAESIPPLDSFIGLLKLSIKGAKLKELPSLKLLTLLEKLDLSGAGIEKLPDEISDLINLKHLHVPHLKLIQEFGWKEINNPPRYLDWQEWEGFEISRLDGGKPYVLVQGTNLFKRLKDNNQLSKASQLFKEMNVSVHSSTKMHMKEADSNPGTWYNIHSKFRKFQHRGHDGLFLEIQGFDDYPVEVIEVLKKAEYVSLVDDKFLKNISDENLKSMKGCSLDRCTEVRRIYKEPDTLVKSERKLKFAENLEILQISGLLNLRSFYDGGKEQCFKKLRELYIDSCPSLETVFSSEQILDELQTLHIKSCGSLKTVFGQGDQNQASDQFASASKLKQLYIQHCPMLETVYSSPQLPEELEKVEIKFCAKLQRVFGTKDSTTNEVLKVHSLNLSNLPEFTTVGVKFQSSKPEEVYNCPNLKSETITGETGEINAAQ